MKLTLLLLLPLLMTGCHSKVYESSKVICDESAFCVDLKGKPISGTLINKGEDSEEVNRYRKGLLHGKSEIYQGGSLLVESVYVNGIMHGVSKHYDIQTGILMREMEMADGKAHGKTVHYFENGSPQQECSYKDNLKHGSCITYNDEGKKQSETLYENGELISFSSLYFIRKPGDNVSDIDLSSPIREETLNCTDEMYCEYKNGNKVTGAVVSHGSSSKTVMEFVEGLRNGRQDMYIDSLLDSTVYFKDGVLHGKFISYQDGRLHYINEMVDGARQGASRWFYQDGSLQHVSQYRDDLLHGKYIVYNKDGSIDYISNYQDGERLDYTSYNKDGSVNWYSED